MDKKIHISNLPSVKKEEIKKFRTSGHFVDQKLKNNYSAMQRGIDLFDTISSDNIKNKVSNDFGDINNTTKVIGINLTKAQDRLLNCIIVMLQQKSDLDFCGNLPPENHRYGSLSNVAYPKLRFSPKELFCAYGDKKNLNDVSQSEIDFIKKTLFGLQDTKFLMVYKRYRWEINKDKQKVQVVDRIEEYQSLLRVLSYHEGLAINEDTDLDMTCKYNKKEEIVLLLNPILIDQIDTKFIEYPVDINKRMAIAAGSGYKVTDSMVKLRDYLIRAISYARKKQKDAQNCIISLGFDKMVCLLGLHNYVAQGRRKMLLKRLSIDIETMKNLGIISQYNTKNVGRKISSYDFFLNLMFPDVIIMDMLDDLRDENGVLSFDNIEIF